MREYVGANHEQIVAIPALQILVKCAGPRIGAHDGAAGIVRALVGNHGPGIGARTRRVELGWIHGFGNVVNHLRCVCSHFVFVRLVVERHAHQRLAKRIAIGRIEIKAIVAVRHHTAGRVDRHRGLVPFRCRSLPFASPLRRAAGHTACLGEPVHELARSQNVQPANGSVRACRHHLEHLLRLAF